MTDTFWVAPRLTGGIGNRIFQTLAAIAVAEETGRKPVFLLPRTSRCEHGAYETLFTLFPSLPILPTAQSWVEVQEGDPIPSTDQPIVLKGFFQQHPRFPSLYSPHIPRLLSDKEPMKEVAVHFRYGDYLNLPHHQVPLTQYYENALRCFPTNLPLRLFSDSPSLVESFANKWRAAGRTVTISHTTEVLATFKEMAACQGGCIGCNSTFGFWAAWFAWRHSGNPSSYTAIFPETWMQPGQPIETPVFLHKNPFAPYIRVLRL